jgi:hypothetical protein
MTSDGAMRHVFRWKIGVVPMVEIKESGGTTAVIATAAQCA